MTKGYQKVQVATLNMFVSLSQGKTKDSPQQNQGRTELGNYMHTGWSLKAGTTQPMNAQSGILISLKLAPFPKPEISNYKKRLHSNYEWSLFLI
ncbi:MAG: hypothetical protein ACJAY8_000427 [Sphingobacteriales bacterium]